MKEIVYKYYGEGFHCAEVIANTIHETFPEKSDDACKATAGFRGGIGRCKQDVCGALAGGIIAIGSIYGRETGKDDIAKALFLSSELRRVYIDEFKTTVCKDVIENISNIPEYESCKDVTAKTTWLLYNLIKEDLNADIS